MFHKLQDARAYQTGHVEVIKYILEHVTDKNPKRRDGRTPLHCAVLNNSFGNLEMFKILAENVTDKNPAQNNGMTPLDMAVQMGLLEFVKYILPHESDVKVS